MQNANQQPTCAVCKTIRYFLMAAVPILVLVYVKPELDLPEMQLQVLIGNILWVGLPLLIAWKYYWEIWKPKRKRKARLEAKKMREEQDQQTSLEL